MAEEAVIRRLSHSEIAVALDCEAKHAYAYTGRLTDNTTLKPKVTPVILREGRAWGVAVAAYCQNVLLTDADVLGEAALKESLAADADQLKGAGAYDAGEHARLVAKLTGHLDRYARMTEPLPLTRLEHELVVPIPARASGRRSNVYRLQTFFDGIHTDLEGRVWVVEFKLRGQLAQVDQIQRGPQYRRYAWAAREQLDVVPAGFIVDEWLNVEPQPARILKNGRPSHDASQRCLPEDYLAACEEHGEGPRPGTLERLRARRWHSRTRILFRESELDQVGRELVSAAQLIRDLDSGVRDPIPNPSQVRCPSCQFRQICPESEGEVIDMLFERGTPKRLRGLEEADGVVSGVEGAAGRGELDGARGPRGTLSGGRDRFGVGTEPVFDGADPDVRADAA